jgi:hypothetical protein
MKPMASQIDHLNCLLKGELSAVQTYDMALDKAKTPEIISALQDCKACHSKRVTRLSDLIVGAGGTPTCEAGAWGAFAKTVEGGAAILGEKPAVGSLQEGEDHGIELYKGEMKHLEGPFLQIIEAELFPAQERTQKRISHIAA